MRNESDESFDVEDANEFRSHGGAGESTSEDNLKMNYMHRGSGMVGLQVLDAEDKKDR